MLKSVLRGVRDVELLLIKTQSTIFISLFLFGCSQGINIFPEFFACNEYKFLCYFLDLCPIVDLLTYKLKLLTISGVLFHVYEFWM